MVLLAIVRFGLSVYKIVAGRWTLPLAGVNTLVILGNGLLAILMLTDRGLWNPELITRIQGALGTSAESMDAILSSGALWATVVIVIICIPFSVMGFLRCQEVRLPRKVQAWLEAER